MNDGTKSDDVLNESCGADFVKVTQKAAKNLEGFVDGERWQTHLLGGVVWGTWSNLN